MKIDTNCFLGGYPFWPVPAAQPEDLLQAMDRVGIDQAWVSYLPALFWRDPMLGNRVLFDLVAKQERLHPVPVVHPGLPGWRLEVESLQEEGAIAVRADPMRQGLDPAGPELRELADTTALQGLPMVIAVRLEDSRQRHPIDGSTELPPSAIRKLIRGNPDIRLLVTHASRAEIEEVHFGSTSSEAERIWWDVSWIWGPPEDHLSTLLDTIGGDRFVLGTGQPLRLPEAAMAKLDLLDQELYGQLRENTGKLAGTTG